MRKHVQVHVYCIIQTLQNCVTVGHIQYTHIQFYCIFTIVTMFASSSENKQEEKRDTDLSDVDTDLEDSSNDGKLKRNDEDDELLREKREPQVRLKYPDKGCWQIFSLLI